MDVHLVSFDVLMGWGNHMGTFGVDGVDHIILIIVFHIKIYLLSCQTFLCIYSKSNTDMIIEFYQNILGFWE